MRLDKWRGSWGYLCRAAQANSGARCHRAPRKWPRLQPFRCSPELVPEFDLTPARAHRHHERNVAQAERCWLARPGPRCMDRTQSSSKPWYVRSCLEKVCVTQVRWLLLLDGILSKEACKTLFRAHILCMARSSRQPIVMRASRAGEATQPLSKARAWHFTRGVTGLRARRRRKGHAPP